MKNRIICFAVSLMMLVGCVVLCSCSEADKVNRNISKQANYFEAERRITVYNARTTLSLKWKALCPSRTMITTNLCVR
jgi:hypothetical protein